MLNFIFFICFLFAKIVCGMEIDEINQKQYDESLQIDLDVFEANDLKNAYNNIMRTALDELSKDGFITANEEQNKFNNTLIFSAFISVFNHNSSIIYWNLHPGFATAPAMYLASRGRDFECNFSKLDFMQNIWNNSSKWYIDFYFNRDLMKPSKVLIPETFGRIDLFKPTLIKYMHNTNINIEHASYIFLSGFNVKKFIVSLLEYQPQIILDNQAKEKASQFIKEIQTSDTYKYERWLIEPWKNYL